MDAISFLGSTELPERLGFGMFSVVIGRAIVFLSMGPFFTTAVVFAVARLPDKKARVPTPSSMGMGKVPRTISGFATGLTAFRRKANGCPALQAFAF